MNMRGIVNGIIITVVVVYLLYLAVMVARHVNAWPF